VVPPLLYGWAARRSQPVHSLAARCAPGTLCVSIISGQ